MSSIPKTCKRLMVHKLTVDFRQAVSVDEGEVCQPPQGEVCVRNKFVGINATDVNIAKGRYGNVGSKMPFGVGMEGLGDVVAVGANVQKFKVGQSVAYMSSRLNSYAEYVCVPANELYPIPKAQPEYLALLVSGSTAAIGLIEAARLKKGETVFITAAAGGLGHIAVQIAHSLGCHVIGTSSKESKVEHLKSLGCNRVINYKKENIADVLAKEYPNGVDVFWETIGGEMLEIGIKNLATRGRLIIIGGISSYMNEQSIMTKMDLSYLPSLLQVKAASLIGFKRGAYADCFEEYFESNKQLLESNKLQVFLDDGKESTGEEFVGFEGVIRGVEHLLSGKSSGKVIARIY